MLCSATGPGSFRSGDAKKVGKGSAPSYGRSALRSGYPFVNPIRGISGAHKYVK